MNVVDREIEELNQRLNFAMGGIRLCTKSRKVELLRILLSIVVIGILAVVGVLSFKYIGYTKLDGVVDVGYINSNNLFANTQSTEREVEVTYEQTGIPFYVYASDVYDGSVTNDNYLEDLYNSLFKDDYHVIIVYFRDIDYLGWYTGSKVNDYVNLTGMENVMIRTKSELNRYTEDIAFAKGIREYRTHVKFWAVLLSGLSCLGIVCLFCYCIYQACKFEASCRALSEYKEDVTNYTLKLTELSNPMNTLKGKYAGT